MDNLSGEYAEKQRDELCLVIGKDFFPTTPNLDRG